MLRVARITKAIRYGFLWSKAQDLAAHNKFLKALHKLDDIFGIFSEEGPSLKIPIEANILSSVVFYNLNRKEEAINASRCAIDQLKEGRAQYNTESASYLIEYCRNLIALASGTGGPPDIGGVRGQLVESKGKYIASTLAGVRADLITKFPPFWIG